MDEKEFFRKGPAQYLRRLSGHFPVVVITGARQSGKTTLLRLAFPEYRYVSLDLPSIAEQAEKDPETFLVQHPAPLIVDEVQYAPGLFRHLKSAVDKKRHKMGQYLLTGSQKFNLMKEVAESLAGRLAWYELENFTAADILAYRKQAISEARLIVRGQFPELWRNPRLDARDFYAAYLATYLERDVRQILNVVSLRDFERFIRVLAARNGQVLNKSEIAKDVGVSVKAIGDWLSVLEASNQIVLLEPWHQNFAKRIVKSPKIYFRGSGLVSFLLGVEEKQLSSSVFYGTLFETFIFAEMRKHNGIARKRHHFWFYRDQRAREVDFLLEHAGKLSFMQCKAREIVGRDDIHQAAAIAHELAQSKSLFLFRPARRHYIVCRAHNPYPVADGFHAIRSAEIPQLFH